MLWEMVGGIIAILTLLGGFGGFAVRWILREIKSSEEHRDEAAKRIEDNQQVIKERVVEHNTTMDKRVSTLERDSRDFMSGAVIKDAIDHAARNGRTALDAVDRKVNANTDEIRIIRDRLTIVETKHESTAKLVGEVKVELKETRHEINDRFDQMAKLQQQQFDQLCASIREMRDARVRPLGLEHRP